MDFVVESGETILAVEVKSGRKKLTVPGMEAFSKEFPVKKKLLTLSGKIPLEEFLSSPVQQWLE